MPSEAAAELPEGLEPYRQTDVFTEVSIPAGLRKDHCTKPGVWGLIQVAEGRLRYCVTDPRRVGAELILTPESRPGLVELRSSIMLCRLDPSGFMFNSTVSFPRLCRCVGLKNWQHGKTDCAAEPLRQSSKISLPKRWLRPLLWALSVHQIVNRRANGTPYRRAKGTPCQDGGTLM